MYVYVIGSGLVCGWSFSGLNEVDFVLLFD